MQNGFVGLLAEDTAGLLTGLLGIIKSGNALVPISPSFPDERVEYMVADCRIRVLLTDKANSARARAIAHRSPCLEHIIDLDTLDPEPQGVTGKGDTGKVDIEEVDFAELDMNRATCYMIYTSGSTGMPKGVPISHGNLTPLLWWFCHYFGLNHQTRVLQNLSYTFDFGIFELVTTLMSAGCLYFFNKKELTHLGQYADFIERHGINTLHTTPSFFGSIAGLDRPLPTLRLLHFGGERLTRQLVETSARLAGDHCTIYNGYGPTEATINASVYAMTTGPGGTVAAPTAIPIGRPSAANVIGILDNVGNHRPVGIPGELCISGIGLSDGYLNNPELTEEKFVCFAPRGPRRPSGGQGEALPGPAIGRTYKTGDLAQWLPDGNILYLGRIDQQVKIRGFRIEPGEIESRLLDHEDIREAVVIDRKGNGEEVYLCAYFVPRSDSLFKDPGQTATDLKGFLSGPLPDYMIPAYFVPVDKIPLTPNGKADRRLLPDVATVFAEHIQAPPRNRLEETLAEIWTDIIQPASPIGIDDNFFEIGGHSLKATRMVSEIHRIFNVKISLKNVFVYPTIRLLAPHITTTTREHFLSVEPAEKRDYYPLSSAQKRMYILQQRNREDTTYHMFQVNLLEGRPDKERLQEVFRQMVQRHESFRTYFDIVAGEPVQRIADKATFSLGYSTAGGKDFEVPPPRPFDLTQPPLLRAELVTRDEETHLLVIDMHHIISDGYSIKVFIDEFTALYRGDQLPSPPLHYKDFALQRSGEGHPDQGEPQRQYWENLYSGDIPQLDLPYDYPVTGTPDNAGGRFRFRLPGAAAADCRALVKKEESTPFMFYLAAYLVLLHKLSWQEDIVVGTPVAGREHAELQGIIGMFVNTLALRNYPRGGQSFREFLGNVRQNTLTAFENRDYPFEELVEKVYVAGDNSRSPLFDTMFAMQNLDIPEAKLPGLTISDRGTGHPVSRFDLTLIVQEGEEGADFLFEYRTCRFKSETVERLAGYLEEIINQVTQNPAIPLDNIEIASGLADSEKTIYEEASEDFGF